MLDIIKILGAPIIGLLEKLFNKEENSLKQLQSINLNEQPMYHQEFLRNSVLELSFKQRTGISTNYSTIEKLETLYKDISEKTKWNVKVLKIIYDFIDVSKQEAEIKISNKEKKLGSFLLYTSLLGIFLCIVPLIVFISISDIKGIIDFMAPMLFFSYFLYTIYPLYTAKKIQKILAK